MRKSIAVLFLAAFVVFSHDVRATVTIDWTPVGNPGNANDRATTTGHVYGAIGYNYNIDKYDVTNSQYVEFLNAKDPTGANPLGLYYSGMSSDPNGGINYASGAASGSRYSAISGDENHPVNFVTWYDAIRFANWLNNGQGNGDTETGAYTLLGGTPTPSNGDSITRNAGATVFLPNDNEWYKAAYYNPGTSSYFRYPTRSNTSPIGSSPTALPNHANWGNWVGHLTDVGAYTGTMSPYGAFDMGGNIFQWTETVSDLAPQRNLRGLSFAGSDPSYMASSGLNEAPTTWETFGIGFRVAETPEPSSIVLAAVGVVCLAAWGVLSRSRRARRPATAPVCCRSSIS